MLNDSAADGVFGGTYNPFGVDASQFSNRVVHISLCCCIWNNLRCGGHKHRPMQEKDEWNSCALLGLMKL